MAKRIPRFNERIITAAPGAEKLAGADLADRRAQPEGGAKKRPGKTGAI